MLRNNLMEYMPVDYSPTHKTIALAYDEAFEQGFNVTSKEIMNYLGVSNQWVPRHITNIKFRVINLVAKKALSKYGRPEFKPLHAYTKIYNRKSFEREILRNSFIEVSHGLLLPATRIPKSLISCADACILYKMDRKTFYRRTKSVTKYNIYGLKRYSAREIEHILLDAL
ncbi:hypothetical protein [Listeria newyorkensis]|uniref:hypothetical protein n=1 Tax=Listeria newyorkensis TaxID=1497681 RepID=UPI00051DAA5B|nr:hypothetical protein [Listeria newyorkensis]KGL43559.1 hypothetical protein EP58_07405 [Listeria newyorkensis]